MMSGAEFTRSRTGAFIHQDKSRSIMSAETRSVKGGCIQTIPEKPEMTLNFATPSPPSGYGPICHQLRTDRSHCNGRLQLQSVSSRGP